MIVAVLDESGLGGVPWNPSALADALGMKLNTFRQNLSRARRLLLACLDSSDAVGAMRRFVDFAASRPPHFGVWRLMAQPEQAALVRQVADLFGTSEPLSRGLIGFGRSRAAKDGKGSFTDITEGDLPWKDVQKALSDINFTGWATAEVGGGNVDRLKKVREQMEEAFGM